MNKLRFITLHLLLLAVVSMYGAYSKTTYYANANGKSGATLKSALRTIINGSCDGSTFQQIAYGSGTLNGVWGAFQTTDCASGSTTIIDRYSSITSYTVGTNQGSSSSTEGTGGYNREHSFPKSWFGGSTSAGPGTDLFHLYPTDVMVNNKRSNYPFGEVKTATFTSSTKGGWCSKLGTGGYGSNTSYTVFEPADKWKGDFARTYFYMVTCYENNIVSWYNTYSSSTDVGKVLNGTTHPAFQTWYIQMLLAWAEADPVDDIEIARNEAVMNQQHNRNPFIDFPGLEQYIWGSYSTSYSAYQTTALSVSNYVNPYDGSSSSTPSISVSPTSTSISVGGTKSLSATVSNASGATITWTTSNSSVASLSATSGSSVTVTGVAAGSATITAKITVSGTQYTATCAVTVTSSGGGTSSGDYYTKVTSSSDLTSGQYLIVYEGGNVAFNGGLSSLDATSNTISVTPSNSQIAITSTTEAAEFTIDTSAGTIKSASGLYIGNTSNSNGLTGSSTALTNTISINSGDADIVSSGGAYLRYNATSGQTRFRYYKSSSYSSQQAIQLYKKDESSSSNPVNPTVSFSTSSKSMEVGDTYTQTVITSSNGSVTYSSSNTSVATVNSLGKVTAVSAGTATITANVAATSSYNAGSAQYTVTVTRKTPTLTFATSTKSMTVGDTYTQTATYSGDGTVSYTSSNTSVATVNSSTGLVTAKAAGTTTITATSTQTTTYSSATATYTVTVSAAAVPSITVSPSTASIEVGNTTTLTATTENAGTATVSWSSSNTSVATVSGGVVTGVAAGTATVTASITVSGTTYTDACTVTVTSSGGSGSEDVYTKVTSAPSDWSGDYLIVYEGGNLAMNGALTADANSNSISVTISNNEIAVTSATEAAEFTIASMTGGYSIMTKGGKYIGGNSNQNNVTYSTSAILNTLSISNGDVTILSNTRTLCYRDDAANTQTRFRYYANPGNYNAIQLYKKTSSGGTTTEPEDPTASFSTTNKSMTVGETYTQTVTTNSDGDVTYSSSNTSVATVDATTGQVTAVAAGTATITASVAATSSYNAGTATYMVTVTRNTPTMSFATSTVNINEGETYTQVPTYNGDGAITYSSSNASVATVDASTGLVTAVSEGTATITATAAQTTMYSSVSATYTVTVQETGYTYFVKVTTAPTDWSGEYLIVYEDGSKAMNGGLTTLDATNNSIDVTIQNQRVAATTANKAATFTVAKSGTNYTLQSKSGRYIGVGSSGYSGVLSTSTTTTYSNSINLSNGETTISATYSSNWGGSSTYYLRYYTNGPRFRYYTSTTGNYKPVALYKKVKMTYQVGDVNKDGSADILDVPTLAGYLVGTVSASEIDLTAADVDGDGEISLADLTALVNQLK